MGDSRLLCQALVIGSGIAGSSCALTLADNGFDVILLCAGNGIDDGNTAYAQGGIVYTGPDDSPKLLQKDVTKAGWNHNSNRAVSHLSRFGPKAVDELLIERLRIGFAQKDGHYDLTREGGHSIYRVAHCADHTGRSIMDGFVRAVANSPNIRVLTGRMAVDLITSQHHTSNLQFQYNIDNQCLGAYVYNSYSGQVETILANYTVLATGGLGRIYQHTTNAECCVGSALTMAHRAGARIMNMEYVQFHPTSLYYKAKRRFLITEAMRGEGARLINSRGEQFMHRYDRRGELAPRDIVSRGIVDELHSSGEDCVFLDCSTVPHDLPTRFPTVYNGCKKIGIDITREPIPVVPAAHYHCGGVLCDVSGKTTVSRLYAVGECSCTGVHGANRLASTSLLEGVLWGKSAGESILGLLKRRKQADKRLVQSIPDWSSPGHDRNEDPALIAQDWATIRSTMWNYAGITRTDQRLQRAVSDLKSLNAHLVEFYKRTPMSKPLIELFHGSYSAYLVAVSAARNKQNIGCHYVSS
ncbi:L-aspartate oxidase [Desulfovibrio inopinatus]|uniref:L-aspartate oxidase n=1 Tax=Desulfovibrio inopinatus TaxID=102109 RepID=UPI0003FF2C08|nr:L-aspartate oxidase [Desulfovibrio inopinatus]